MEEKNKNDDHGVESLHLTVVCLFVIASLTSGILIIMEYLMAESFICTCSHGLYQYGIACVHVQVHALGMVTCSPTCMTYILFVHLHFASEYNDSLSEEKTQAQTRPLSCKKPLAIRFFRQKKRKRYTNKLVDVKRKRMSPSYNWKNHYDNFPFCNLGENSKLNWETKIQEHSFLFMNFHRTCIFSGSYSTFPATPIRDDHESEAEIPYFRLGNTRAFLNDGITPEPTILNRNSNTERTVDLSLHRRSSHASYSERVDSLMASSGYNSLVLYDNSSFSSGHSNFRPPSSGYTSERHRLTSGSFSFSSSMVVDVPNNDFQMSQASHNDSSENHVVNSDVRQCHEEHREDVVSTPSQVQQEITETVESPIIRPFHGVEDYMQTRGACGGNRTVSLRDKEETKLLYCGTKSNPSNQNEGTCNGSQEKKLSSTTEHFSIIRKGTRGSDRELVGTRSSVDSATQSSPLTETEETDNQDDSPVSPQQQYAHTSHRKMTDHSHINSDHYGSYDRLQNTVAGETEEASAMLDEDLYGHRQQEEGLAESSEMPPVLEEGLLAESLGIPNFDMLGIHEEEDVPSNVNGCLGSGDEENTDDHTD